MITFIDGPAMNATLELRRAPLMLRVVRDRRTGDIDGLDQPDDAPDAHEDVFVYRLTQRASWVHICRSRGRGGMRPMAEYAEHTVVPITQEQLRTRRGWVGWCEGNAALLVPVWFRELEREQDEARARRGVEGGGA